MCITFVSVFWSQKAQCVWSKSWSETKHMPSLLHQAIMLFKSSVLACTFKETSLSLSCLDLAILLALEILACSEEEKNIQCFCSNQSLLLTLLHILFGFSLSVTLSVSCHFFLVLQWSFCQQLLLSLCSCEEVAIPFWWGVIQTKVSIIWVLSSVRNPLWKKLCRRPFYGLQIWTAFCSTMFPTPWFQSRISSFTIQQCTAKGLLSLSKSLGFRFLRHTAAAQHQVLEVELRIIDTDHNLLCPLQSFNKFAILYFLPCVESCVQRVSSFSPARDCSTKKIPFWGFFVCISSCFCYTITNLATNRSRNMLLIVPVYRDDCILCEIHLVCSR